jgi:tetratricopeptide (TPR) repeat protein
MTPKGWRALAGAAMMIATMLLGSHAVAQTQQQIDWCVNGDGKFSPDQVIGACTAAIKSGKWSGKAAGWAFGNRCIGYKDRGDYDRAIVDCDQAIRLDPSPKKFNSRAAAYYFKHDYDHAIADYSEAIRLDPKFVDPIHNRGLAYAAKGDLDRAIADYNEAIRLDPRDFTALCGRGVARRRNGDTSGGDADIAEAKTINANTCN